MILVVFICYFVVVDYLMKCFYTARHLAAKSGTNNGVLIRYVLFVMYGLKWGCCFLGIFF